ncbi:MAG: CapA family protein [Clostridia bacterium]|nr:CapA family protein [Clostridia bacterium]
MKQILSIVLSLILLFPSVAQDRLNPKGRVRMLAVGDNIVHGAVYTDAKRNAAALVSTDGEHPAYSFDSMYAHVANAVAAADVAILNQEGPVTSRPPSGYPRFNAPPQLAKALAATGFDVVNLANNHALDQSSGLAETLSILHASGLASVGAYATREEKQTVRVVEANGVRTAFLAYTFFTNGLSAPKDAPWGVQLWEEALVRSQMSEAREQADFTVVSVHWGEEGATDPNESQRSAARLLAELGADVILGHHPHVLQPIEWLDRPDGGRTLVAYSLGNFLSAMLYPRYMVGGMLAFTLNKKEHTVKDVVFVPTVCHYERAVSAATDGKTLKTRSGLAVYPLSQYTEELASRHGATLYADFTRDTLVGYVKEMVAEEFLAQDDALGTHTGKQLPEETHIHQGGLFTGIHKGDRAVD